MDRNVKKDEQRKWLLGKLKKLEAVKYPLLVLLLGAGLLLIPWGGGNTEQAAKPVQTEETVDLAAELEALLTQLEGAGEVRVLLTVAEGVSHTLPDRPANQRRRHHHRAPGGDGTHLRRRRGRDAHHPNNHLSHLPGRRGALPGGGQRRGAP